MKRVDRHVLGVFGWSWAAAVVFFAGMFVLIHFFSRVGRLEAASRALTGEGLGVLSGFLSYYAVSFPFIIVELLPFTILMAAMWTMQHLSRRNELVPLLTSGISLRRICTPILLSTILIGLVFSAVRESVLPDLARQRKWLDRLIKGDDKDNIRNIGLLADGRGRLFLIHEYDLVKRIATCVDILDADDPGRHLGHVSAMRFETGPLGKGWYALPEAEVSGDLDFPLRTDLKPRDIEIESASLRYLAVDDLRTLIARRPDDLDLQLRMYEHFAYPLNALILVLLGLPLVLRGEKRTPYMAVGMSLLISLAWFSLGHLCRRMGASGEIIDPLLGAWLPVLLGGSVGLIFFETIRT